jgi:hypothetical protein
MASDRTGLSQAGRSSAPGNAWRLALAYLPAQKLIRIVAEQDAQVSWSRASAPDLTARQR